MTPRSNKLEELAQLVQSLVDQSNWNYPGCLSDIAHKLREAAQSARITDEVQAAEMELLKDIINDLEWAQESDKRAEAAEVLCEVLQAEHNKACEAFAGADLERRQEIRALIAENAVLRSAIEDKP